MASKNTIIRSRLRLSGRAYRRIYTVPVMVTFLWTTCVCLCVVAQFPVDPSPATPGAESNGKGGGAVSASSAAVTDTRSFEYPECTTDDVACIEEHKEKDRLGKEAIMQLHKQMDDDRDGEVELSESDEFLRDELKYVDDFERHTQLHGNDKEISVEDLWKTWKYSEVYNWTVDRTSKWLEETVELPQYAERFQNNGIEGSALPRLATNNGHFMTAILGITDAKHRQKISLKAMDVVLFGPPKPMHNYLKDWLLVLSLVVALGGCWFAFIQHRYSQSHVKQLLREMETLSRAEDSLKELQEKLDVAQEEHKSAVREKQTIEKQLTDEIERAKHEAQRLHVERNEDEVDGNSSLANKLRLAEEELVQVRCALEEAERRLSEQRNWSAPMTLQQWLQLTYEIEYRYYVAKRVSAAKQLQEAKEECEKLRRKRASLIGSFRIAHGGSLDAVDQRIVSARSALHEVTAELKERTHRWTQIEVLCQFAITNNPGFQALMGNLVPATNGSDASGGQSPEVGIEGLAQSVGSVIGSMTHMAECNPPMGMDECDEDVPPAPQMFSAMQAASMPRPSSQEFRRVAGQTLSQSQQNLVSAGGTQLIHRSHPQQPAKPQAGTSIGTTPAPPGAGSVSGNGMTTNKPKYILGGDSSFERMSSQDSSSSLPSTSSLGSPQQPQGPPLPQTASTSSLTSSQSQGMGVSPPPPYPNPNHPGHAATNPSFVAASSVVATTSHAPHPSNHTTHPHSTHPPHPSASAARHSYRDKRSSTHPLLNFKRNSFDSSFPPYSASTLPPLDSQSTSHLPNSRSDSTLSALGVQRPLNGRGRREKDSSRVKTANKNSTKLRRDQLKKLGMMPTAEEEVASSSDGDIEVTKKKHRLRLPRLGTKQDKIKTS
ncbi:stromal interaction molecule 2-like [Diadema antillarum]|uniref:stromal interaction molecule 2-like n=1 Tax=Diadema antillarum TaxID=105358 RepID=UPI003A862F03